MCHYLKLLRKHQDLTLNELGEKMGVTNSYLSQIENGKKGFPSSDFLIRFSNSININPIQLLKKFGYIDDSNFEGVVLMRKSKTIIDRLNYVADQLEDAIHQIDEGEPDEARDSIVYALEELREEE